MKQTKIVPILVLLVTLLLFLSRGAQAATITARKLTLSSSSSASSNATTTYTFSFTVVDTTTIVQSFSADICSTASGSCSIPTGFSNSSSTISQPSGLGDVSGWTVNTATAGSLRMSKSGNSAAPSGSQTVTFNNVQNPTTTNQTFFARITTYSNANWTGAIDTGTVAASTANQPLVSLGVDETLTFCVYTGANCAAGGSNVSLGTASSSLPSSGTNKIDAASNAGSGYAITVNGSTLTSGLNTITAITAGGGAASSPGTEQFGLNLRDNTTPNVGTDPSGDGGFSYGTGYGTVDNFKFVSGNTIASTSGSTNNTTYTVSYLANIQAATEAGSYTTTLTYICTATY